MATLKTGKRKRRRARGKRAGYRRNPLSMTAEQQRAQMHMTVLETAGTVLMAGTKRQRETLARLAREALTAAQSRK